MKKLSIILTIALIFSTMFSYTFADTNQAAATNSPGSVSISFKIGDEILKINGKEIKVVKPYAVNGNTLVPLRVITEAFGADVKWEPSDSSITIKYDDVTIVLKLQNTEAIINNQKVKIAAAPVAINGTTMVPLRFITENFGAEVSYNNDTKEITVTKEVVSDSSIKDFSELLKRSTKERVGDSYYKWSIELPEGFESMSRNDEGNTTVFTNVYEDEYVYISVADKTDETYEYIMQSETMAAVKSRLSILEAKLIEADGVSYVRILTKDYEGIYESRFYIANGRIYTVGVELYDTPLSNTDKFKKYLDSFKYSFTDLAITEDLSEYDADGYKIVSDDKLKYSFKIPAGWADMGSSKENVVGYFDLNGSSENYDNEIRFNMYSKGTITSLDNWVAKQKQFIIDEFNPLLVKLIDEKRIKVNGYDCAVLTSTYKFTSERIYYVDAYIVGKNYRYQLYFKLSEEDYNKQSYKAVMENVINSIKISEPDAEKVGLLYDAQEVMTNNKLYKVNGPSNKWSYDLPMNWSRVTTSNPSTEYLYKDAGSQIIFAFLARTESAAELIKYYGGIVADAEKTGNFKNLSKEVLNEKGATIYKYTNSLISNDSTQTEYYYIIDKDGKVYVTYYIIDDIRKSDSNLKLINNIWNSITLN